MPTRIAVIVESPADFRHVSELIDRKVQSHAPDWWDEGSLEAEREYCGLQPGTNFTCWRELRGLPLERGLLRRGGIAHAGSEDRYRFDFPLGRKALIVCALAETRVDAVVLMRDMDQQPAQRTTSLEAARDENLGKTMEVVLALPQAKREAWTLAGWIPRNRREESILKELRDDLHFHPCESAERLSAAERGAQRDAKRVLAKLTDGKFEREQQCWLDTPWEMLRARGQQNGLAQFLAEVKNKLVPKITGTM